MSETIKVELTTSKLFEQLTSSPRDLVNLRSLLAFPSLSFSSKFRVTTQFLGWRGCGYKTEDRIQVFHLFILAPSCSPYFWNVVAQSFKRASHAFFMAKTEPGSHAEGECRPGWVCRRQRDWDLHRGWANKSTHIATLLTTFSRHNFRPFLLRTSHYSLNSLQDNMLP